MVLSARYEAMEKGFNSDVDFMGANHHVQTEDWGIDNPFLVSRVFKNGAVLKSLKIPYKNVIPIGHETNNQAIRLALKLQHQKILDLLLSGQLL